MSRITKQVLESRIHELELQQTAMALLIERAARLEPGAWINSDFDAFMDAARAALPAEPVKRVYQPKPAPDWVLARREAMAKAKALAMRTQRTVGVSLDSTAV